MNNFPNKSIVNRIRHDFPVGIRVKLVKMDDAQAPPIGTCGTVLGVDDIATIHISWDNGSSLGAVYGEDIIERID